MAVIQIRNAAGAKGVEREEMPKRDLISKRAMKFIIEKYEIRIQAQKDAYRIQSDHRVNQVIDYYQDRLSRRERLTYYVGAVTLFIGGGLGWLIP